MTMILESVSKRQSAVSANGHNGSQGGAFSTAAVLFMAVFWFMGVLNVQAQAKDSSPLRVMSYNIRFNNPADGVNAWPHRKEHVAELIRQRYEVDLAGLQEVLKGQLDDLLRLMPGFACVGVGRDDGREAGEYSPIFYRTDRLELLDQGTFWLSETPSVPGSKSWDSALTRIVTWARFRDRQEDFRFYHFNSHFDHRGEQARIESSRLLLSKIASIAAGNPVVVTADLNAQEKFLAYRILVQATEESGGGKALLKDARYVSRSPHQGPTASFNDWQKHGEPETRIDYILVTEHFLVEEHHILTDQFDGRYPSDHLPVLAVIRFNPEGGEGDQK
jgi:endonuclease/exonuclease/phosphatase family metal-dependent hydrolase